MQTHLVKRSNGLLVLFIFLLLSSCHVMLVGRYDEKVDESVQKISREVSTLLVTVENNLDNNKAKENDYIKFRDTYISLLAEGQILVVRTRALPKYEKVSQMVVALNQNLKDLEALHKTGFKNKQLVETARTLIETSLIAVLSAENALKREKSS